MKTIYAAIVSTLVIMEVAAQIKVVPLTEKSKVEPQPNTEFIEAKTDDPLVEVGNTQVTSVNKASSFIGTKVHNSGDQPIGEVQDLVFDLNKGQIGYAVVVLDAAGGPEARKVPIPVTALKAKPGEDYLTLNMSESVLAAAAGVTEGEWPAVDIFAVGGPAEAESGTGSSSQTTPTEPTPGQPAAPTEITEPNKKP